VACGLLFVSVGRGAAQEASRRPLEVKVPIATVELRVYVENNGKFLEQPAVHEFISADGKNFASRFHYGVAEGIPYGVYKIYAYREGYTSIGGLVSVYQPKVTVVRGMAVGTITESRNSLRGRVIGTPPPHSFVRLVGIYSDETQDSAIGSGGSFSFDNVSDRNYVLFVIGEGSSILASRILTTWDRRPPLVIQLQRDQLGCTPPSGLR
jgi:hypothetical protein